MVDDARFSRPFGAPINRFADVGGESWNEAGGRVNRFAIGTILD
jgi:hypothetical protein